MINVNSKKTMHLLAKNTFRSNRMRNLFVVTAIMLTMVLFTGLFATVSCMVKSLEEGMMRQVGGSAHGSLKNLSMEQYERIKEHKSIREISYSVVLAVADNEELGTRPAEMRYANDELEAEMMLALPTTGRMPEAENEIAADTLVLEKLGAPAELGQKVTLSYSLAGKKHRETFTLVGFWNGDLLTPASQIWLSRSYVKNQLSDYVPTDEADMTGQLNADVKFRSAWLIEKKLLRVMKDCGYQNNEIVYGVNRAYLGGWDVMNPETIMGGCLVVALIVVCGYLIISNIFYIGITRDIRYYGLLKAIGTTGRQIKSLVRRQALWLCVPGVVLGALFGSLFGIGIGPAVMSVLDIQMAGIYLHPLVFVFAGVFSVITVLVSIAKPSSIAAKVSPMEAVCTTDGTLQLGRATKKSGGIRLRKMAWDNVMRNKKKMMLVTISLSLGMVILNLSYSLANSLDMDQYLENVIGNDFAIADAAYFNVNQEYENQDTIGGEFIGELESLEGVERISNLYFQEQMILENEKIAEILALLEKNSGMDIEQLLMMGDELESEMLLQHVYGLDDDVWNRFIVRSGEIDKEKLLTGNYVIAGSYDGESEFGCYHVGDVVEIESQDGEDHRYEVLAVADLPYYYSIRHYHPVQLEFYLPSEIFLSDIAVKEPMLTVVDATDVNRVENFLRDYCEEHSSGMQYQSRSALAAEYESMKRVFRFVGLALSILLAMIGIANFANTVITSVLERRREQAILQSIGMTNRQTIRMLVCEGLTYMFLALCATLLIGGMVCFAWFGVMMNNSFFTVHITVMPLILCIPILLLVTVLVPYLAQKHIGKMSIIERLRQTE